MGKGNKKVTRGAGWQLIPARPGAPARRDIVSAAPDQQSIRVREENRAQGKVVTVAQGFRLSRADLEALGKELKAHCGAGGTAEDDAIEVQGRHRAKVVELLAKKGYGVRP
jgi:translation initiation factor 1